MGCPSEVEIGDNLVFSVCTHDPDTGVLTDADAVPDYRVYEDETGTAILTGSMAKLDDANTTGFYSESIECSSGNGFENGKTYTVYIEATVDSDQGGICFGFKAYDYRKSNVTAVDDDTTAADNLELAFDGTGYAFTNCTMPWNGDWDAEVESECNDALVALKLDHLVAVAEDDDPVDNSIVAKLAASDGDWSGFDNSTDSLEALADGTLSAATIADAVWDELSTGHTDAGKAGAQLWTDIDAILTDSNELQTDWTDGGRLDTILDSILTDTAEIGAAGAGLTAVPWNADWDAEVQSECNDALVALKLDHLVAVAEDDDPVNDSIIAKLAAGDGDWSAFTESTDSLQAIANAIESAEDIADAVWDEVLTGATHNIANSAGRRLREIGGFAIRQDTAQDGDTQTITLDAGASSTDDIYVGDLAVIVGGTGAGQTRQIISYDGGSKVATVNSPWEVNPDNTSEFQLLADISGDLLLESEITSVTDQTHIVIDDGSSVDDVYNNQTIVLFDDSDDDAPSVRTVSDYDGDTQTVTLSAAPDFTVASDDSVKIFVTPAAVSLTGPTAADVADAVWDETSTGHTDAGKAGAQLWTDIDAILADSNELQGDWTDGGRLDLLIDAILADTNELQGDITDGGRIDLILDAILADTAALPGNILDETIEGTLTYRQIIKIFLAVLAGKSSGGGSQSLAFRDNADAKNRVAATVDANGNRTAVTLDGS